MKNEDIRGRPILRYNNFTINSDTNMYFTQEFLVDIIKRFGPDKLLMSTNCNGAPTGRGDYVFVYGTAKEVLYKLERGTKTVFV